MQIYYHFTSDKLRNGDPVPPIGEWLEYIGQIEPCKCGLHASEHPFDALQYAPGYNLHKVELGGQIIPHGDPVDKVVAQKRKIIATINAEPICRAFARRCAMDVIDKWNAPAVVRQYIETGDESLRAAEVDAARAAAWAAARAAARAAAWAAASDAASDAAWAAAWAAASDAASDAAWAAARAAAITKYRTWFAEMVEAEFAKGSL